MGNANGVQPRAVPMMMPSGETLYVLDLKPEAIHLADIAIALGQTPRWGGCCYRESPKVTDHLMFCYEQGRAEYGDQPLLLLHLLLHDAHEVVVGDVRCPLQPFFSRLKEFSDLVDAAIYESLGLPLPDADMQAIVRNIDDLGLKVEGVKFMHPNWLASTDIDARTAKALRTFPYTVHDDLGGRWLEYTRLTLERWRNETDDGNLQTTEGLPTGESDGEAPARGAEA